MNLFLFNWVNKMIDLYNNGIKIIPYDTNESTWQCKVVISCMCLDTPAKASVQNFKQFNSKQGACPVCTHPVIRMVKNLL